MDPAPNLRFRTRLWLSVVLLLVSLAVLVGNSIVTRWQQHEEQARIEATGVARTLAGHFEVLVSKLKLALQLLATEVELQTPDRGVERSKAFVNIAKVEENLPNVVGIRLFDAEGQLVLSGKGKSSSVKLEDEPYLARLLDARFPRMAIFMPHRHEETAAKLVDFAWRIEHVDGRFAGAIVAQVPLDRIERMLAAADTGPNGAAILLGPGFELIARHPPLPGSPDGDIYPDELRRRLNSGENAGSFLATSPADNVERLYTFRAVEGHPLYVAVGRATSGDFGHWRRDMGIVVTLSGMLLVVVLGAGMMIDRAWRRQRGATRLFEFQAHTDELTGLANRRRFFEMAEAELARTRRYDAPLSVLMLDIDHFKKVNDTHGHRTGDQVLAQLARTCQGVLRNVDIAGRIGGEEFAILLPETALEGAVEVAERLREAIEKSSVPREAGASLRVTVSIGVTTLAGSLNLDELMSQADAALYDAKRGGRNRVCVFSGAA